MIKFKTRINGVKSEYRVVKQYYCDGSIALMLYANGNGDFAGSLTSELPCVNCADGVFLNIHIDNPCIMNAFLKHRKWYKKTTYVGRDGFFTYPGIRLTRKFLLNVQSTDAYMDEIRAAA